MNDDYNPVDSLLSEVLGNTNFLGKLLFPNIKILFVFVFIGALVAINLLAN